MTLPNFFTSLRIVLIPVFVLVFYLPFTWARVTAVIIFVFAAITDWLDGFLARSLSQTSRLGAFLDPVADKLVVVMALCLLIGEHKFPFIAIPAAIIIGREIIISALREWMAELGKRASVAVSYIGKVKTSLQMLAISLLLLSRTRSLPYNHLVGVVGYVALYVAAFLTLWSMILYIKAAWYDLKSAA